MGDNLDNVFVSLDNNSKYGMPVLEWALDHFDSDKTKIILTPVEGSRDSKELTKIAQEQYLPGCAEKKFIAEILIPQANRCQGSILELVNKHGMRKLVFLAYIWNSGLSMWYDRNPTLCCKIWVVDEHNGELILVRDTAFDPDVDQELEKVTLEVAKSWNSLAKRMLLVHQKSMTKLEQNTELLMEEHKKHFEKSLARSEQALQDLKIVASASQHELEQKLLPMTEAAEELRLLNEKKLIDMQESARKKKEANDLLCQDNIRLKQHISLANNYHQATLSTIESRLDSLQSDYINLQANDDYRATLSTIESRLDSLQSEYIKLQAERDHAVKESDKLRNGISFSDFTLQELENATQNFSASLELGKGAFGCVYKGYIREKNVAIKILNSESMDKISGFNTEVAILSTIRHPNIVTLLGACHDASALVFEFLPNGSLESHLECANKATSLTWQIRTHIMAEISLALIFLHSNAENMIIHGDLKPDNILLDSKFVSKLGDFGISRFLKKPDSDSTACYETYHPIGTPGYMDPEFINSGMLTEKADVYSFGVVILRLLTRKPAMSIALLVENAIENGTFHEILDASAGEWPLDQAKELAKLAIRCAQVARKARPNLFEVWPIIERLRRNL